MLFTEGHQHGQVLHAVIHLQASGGERDAERLVQTAILEAAHALLQLKDKIAPLYVSFLSFFFSFSSHKPLISVFIVRNVLLMESLCR